MTYDFYELQIELNKQKREIALTADFYTKMSSPDFDPLDHGIRGFTGYEMSRDIADHIQGAIPLDTAKFQLFCVGISIKQLEAAMLLIEVQKAYENTLPSPGTGIDNSAAHDGDGFTTLLKKTFDLKTRNQNAHLPLTVHLPSFFKKIGDITDEFARLENGRFSAKIAAQNSAQLIEKIYESRMYFAELSLVRTGAVVENADDNLEAVLFLKKAIDEGIINPSRFAHEMVKNFMGEVREQIAAVVATHAAIGQFLEKTFDMDQNNGGLKDFEPTTYVPASIRDIAEFTP